MNTKPDYILPKREKMFWFNTKILSWAEKDLRDFPWRKKSSSNYKKVITEILLQRTMSETISKFSPEFFLRYPTWKALSEAKPENIEILLKPIGLSKQRAPRLVSLAKAVIDNGHRIPRERNEIDKLPGVGQYIANSIELLCFGKPKPLLDVNMARVLERYFGPRKLADIRYDPYLQKLATQIIVNSEDPIKMNWSILDFAALVCRKRAPLCNNAH
jgi:A/G-specific adenine glycosylase